MPDISVRSSSQASSNNATSINVAVPTGTVTGDVSIVVVHVNGLVTLSDGGAGFTKDREDQETSGGLTLGIFSKRHASDPSGAWAFNLSASSSRLCAIAISFANPSATAIYDVPPSGSTVTLQTSGTTLSIVTINTTIDKSIVCIVGAPDGFQNVITPNATGYTEQQDAEVEQSLNLCTKIITPAGSSGSNTYTLGTDLNSASQIFAVANTAGAPDTFKKVEIRAAPSL